ncbi:glycosyltransferase family 2 protein, partial [Modestobacter versicolor]
MSTEPRVTVVIATRDRRGSLLRSLAHLDGGAPVVVVDNASADGTADAVRAAHPAVEVVELPANTGAVARTDGVHRARTRYVAFADDDSWWEPGALGRAADLLDAHPDVAVVVGRVRMAADGSEDAVTRKHRAEVLGRSPAGPDVLSFPAFAAVVRRDAHPSMNTTWSATSRAKAISWVTTIIVIPSSASSVITASTSPTSS